MELEALRDRRAARRRIVRRRRQALGLLLIVAIATAAIVAANSSGGAPRTAARTTHSAPSGAAESHHAAGAAPSQLNPSSGSGRAGTEPVPILMYHVIAAPPAGAPFPGLYVEPREFAGQMRALKQAGWHAVTLDQLAAYWARGAPLGPGKPIVLSFDNGYHSQYSQALPVLRGLGWVGDENIQLTGLPPSQGGLGQAEVRGLLAAGWELDTQGISHADLAALDAPALRYQVSSARSTLRRRYGVAVNWFCYPSGHYDETVIDAVKAAGYVGSTTVIPGWAHPGDDRYRLHRLRVLGGTTPEQLLAQIAAAREDPPAPRSYTGA